MIKVLSLFSGYGGAEWGLRLAGVPFEVVGWSDIDKGAIKIYELNFPEDAGKNLGDCTLIDTDALPDFDLLTGGFPCTDCSLAGDRDLSKGRTNLYSEIIRIAEAKKPKYLLLENVRGLLSMDLSEDENLQNLLLDKIVRDLKKLGYGVAWKVLNSKDFGVPQNRERIWFVCKLGGWDFMEFLFPEKEKLTLRLKDLLETDVPAKYYLTESQSLRLKERMERDVSHSIRCGGRGSLDRHSWDCVVEPSCLDVYNKRLRDDGVCKTLLEPHHNDVRIVEPVFYNRDEGVKKSADVAVALTASDWRGLNRNQDQNAVFDSGEPVMLHNVYGGFKEDKPREFREYSPTLRTPAGGGHLPVVTMNCLTEAQGRQGSSMEFLSACEKVGASTGRVRRLTPRECFRLMGFLNDEIKLENLSDTALFKLAGNGWDVNLVSKIFKNLFLSNSFSYSS